MSNKGRGHTSANWADSECAFDPVTATVLGHSPAVPATMFGELLDKAILVQKLGLTNAGDELDVVRRMTYSNELPNMFVKDCTSDPKWSQLHKTLKLWSYGELLYDMTVEQCEQFLKRFDNDGLTALGRSIEFCNIDIDSNDDIANDVITDIIQQGSPNDLLTKIHNKISTSSALSTK